MQNLDKQIPSYNVAHTSLTKTLTSKRTSQVHFYIPTELYKKLKRLGIDKEKSIGEMFNEMVVIYLTKNRDL